MTKFGQTTRHGYTGHEMLDNIGLIHMNGRVYDPTIGRFLSADPFTFGGSQGLNHYSYVQNNPLSLIDPTGFKDVKKDLKCNSDLSGKSCGNGGSPNDDPDGVVHKALDHFEGKRKLTLSTPLVHSYGSVVWNHYAPAPQGGGVRGSGGKPPPTPGPVPESPATPPQGQQYPGLPLGVMPREEPGPVQSFVGADDLLGVGISAGLDTVGCESEDCQLAAGLVISAIDPAFRTVSPRSLIPRQGRSEMSSAKVKRLRRDMKKNGYDQSQPIDVANVEGKLIILDGHHRAQAAIGARIAKVPMRVHNVTREQADQLLIEAAQAALQLP